MDLNFYQMDVETRRKWITPGKLPCMFRGRCGCEFTVEPYEERHFAALTEMYETFHPKKAAHGLPPEDDCVRRKWVRETVDNGINLVVINEDRIVGHSLLAPIPPGERAEFGIFVHQDFQNRRIGVNLTCITIGCAIKERYKGLWLIVERSNVQAVALYRDVGFRYQGGMDAEGCMCLDLECMF